jgi:Cyclin, N-terminal domain
MEKKKKRDQKRADLEFFHTMEKNLYQCIQRGELAPHPSKTTTTKTVATNEGVALLSSSPNHESKTSSYSSPANNNINHRLGAGNDHTNHRNAHITSPGPTAKGSVTQPVVSTGSFPSSIQNNKTRSKVRTISGMDRHVIEQLSGHYNNNNINNNNGNGMNIPSSGSASLLSSQLPSTTTALTTKPILNQRATTGGTTTSTTTSTTGGFVVGAATTPTLPTTTNVATANIGATSTTATTTSLIEGRRPPLAQRRVSGGQLLSSNGNIATSLVTAGASVSSVPLIPQQQPSSKVKNTSISSTPQNKILRSMDSLELSPEEINDPLMKSSSENVSNARGSTTLNEAESLRGVDLLVEDDSMVTVSQPEMKPTTAISMITTTHIRRNTGNTMYFDTTMHNPNIDATMQCICGVYRAHIVQYVEKYGNGTSFNAIGSQNFDENIDVFRDDYEQQQTRGRLNHGNYSSVAMNIPTLFEIKAFYREFYQRSQMEHDTIIMSLIYVERLVKQTAGALSPNPYNWRSILFSCMILASKVWDDLSMWNIDFSNVSVAAASSTSSSSSNITTPNGGNLLSAFSLQRINQLELAILTNLNFRTAIPASEYAKYYFLIRTMLIRSGLLGNNTQVNHTNNHNSTMTTNALMKQDEQEVENRTNHYQQVLNHGTTTGQLPTTRRAVARSVDWNSYVGGNNTTTSINTHSISNDPLNQAASLGTAGTPSATTLNSGIYDSMAMTSSVVTHSAASPDHCNYKNMSDTATAATANTNSDPITTNETANDDHHDSEDIDPILGPALLLQQVTCNVEPFVITTN